MGVKTLIIIWSIIFGAYLSVFVGCVSSVYLLYNQVYCYTMMSRALPPPPPPPSTTKLLFGLTKYTIHLKCYYIKHFNNLILGYLSWYIIWSGECCNIWVLYTSRWSPVSSAASAADHGDDSRWNDGKLPRQYFTEPIPRVDRLLIH